MKKFNAKLLEAYFICGTQDLQPKENLPTVLEQALKAGITAFQFRDKGQNSTLAVSERVPMAQKLHQLCQKHHVPFFVDDDVALAKAVDAEGIHVGQSDEAITQVVTEVGQKMIVGYSCSNLAEIVKANTISGIDYYGCGPIFATQSKDDASPVIGIPGLRQLVQNSNRPIVAIGGIKEEDLPAIAQTQAAGAAVISLIAQSSNYQQTIQAIRNAPWIN
ncbi:thiamine phosphate synthase [Lactobacillus sp. ESL0791]|uniref:thiamine phosphate synthase n=1 Tax=Lactobacillus sp. ESL0791 TaxID=2983234 RepID=UPI0023F714A7|nr:thiamine phosphate synthase [Lactobacillus sp. ESL0791]MDF7638014.1 thiamine phosphate synthase [Lactobacillus sp. ESL0791]